MRRPVASCAGLAAAAAASLWLLPGVAAAAGSPPSPSPSPAPPAAVHAHARLSLHGAFTVHRDAVTVPGRLVEVQGVVRPYVAGQWVKVQTSLGARRIRTDRLRIKPAGPDAGAFTERVHSPGPGIVRVKVVHARTREMTGFTVQRAVAALDPRVGPGSTGTFVDLVQQRLAALHLYIPRSGVFDEHTGLALDAYHRLLGWGEGNRSLDVHTVNDLLDGRGAFRVRFARHGRHAEGDLGSQLLALIDGRRVAAIYPISSGKPSTPTILGDYRIYRRSPGYLSDGMYFSSFFTGGYAIHGYNPAPSYPASHGCMRLPIIDAISAYRWLKMGDWVDVYR